MGILKDLKIRRANKKKQQMKVQSRRGICCESCKYCYMSNDFPGFIEYSCWLKDPGFDNKELFSHKCCNYKPCRKYKKYLKMKK